MKLVVALGILLASWAVCAQGACRFSVPAGWDQKATRWEGECRDGYADGLGVIEQSEGFIAGEFAKGTLVPSDDAQRTVSAFAEAEKAANEAASRFGKAGNPESAKFYEAKATVLREQLD